MQNIWLELAKNADEQGAVAKVVKYGINVHVTNYDGVPYHDIH